MTDLTPRTRRFLTILIAVVLSLGCAITDATMPEEDSPPWLGAKDEGAPLVCDSLNADAVAAYNRGVVQEQRGEGEAALLSFREAVENDATFCDAMDNLGLMLRRAGEIDEAVEWYRKSLAIESNNPVALMSLGAALDMQGDPVAAEEVFSTLAELEPDNPEGHYGMGVINIELGNLEEAISHLRNAKDLYHAAHSALEGDADMQLGIAYTLADDCGTALTFFEPLYPSSPEDAELNWYMGVCYLSPESEDLELAKEHLLEAQRLGIVIPPDLMGAIE
jgi:Flp pilus assembly protein TadD